MHVDPLTEWTASIFLHKMFRYTDFWIQICNWDTEFWYSTLLYFFLYQKLIFSDSANKICCPYVQIILCVEMFNNRRSLRAKILI